MDIFNLGTFLALRIASLWAVFQLRISLREWIINNNGRKYEDKE
jgi:hypothetical protein